MHLQLHHHFVILCLDGLVQAYPVGVLVLLSVHICPYRIGSFHSKISSDSKARSPKNAALEKSEPISPPFSSYELFGEFECQLPKADSIMQSSWSHYFCGFRINMTHRSPFIKEQSNVKCVTRTYKNYEAFTVQKHKNRMIELDYIQYRTPIGTRKYFPYDTVHDSSLFPPRRCAGGFKWPLGTSVCCSQSAKKTVATAHNDSQPVHGK